LATGFLFATEILVQWSVGEDGTATEEGAKLPLRRMGGFVNTTQRYGTNYPRTLKWCYACINKGL